MMNARHQRFRACLYGIGLCSLLLSSSGCEIFRGRPKIDDRPPPVPPTTNGKPTAEQLIAYLNRQADLVESIETRDLDIEARAMGSTVDLSGTLACQKPRFFSMVGKKPPFGEQVRLGSNDERFWVYVKQEHTLYHCSHSDYEKGTSMELPVPFQPEWVLEVLGMARITPDENARVEEDKDTFKLIEETSFRGRKARKVTVFYKGEPRDDQPRIASRTIYDDASNKVICTARTSKVTRLSVSGLHGEPRTVTVPRIVTLEWPQQDVKLTLDLGKVTINQQLRSRDFVLPDMGGKQIDLARDQPTSRRFSSNNR